MLAISYVHLHAVPAQPSFSFFAAVGSKKPFEVWPHPPGTPLQGGHLQGPTLPDALSCPLKYIARAGRADRHAAFKLSLTAP